MTISKRLMMRAKHHFRLSALSTPYWQRRRSKIARTGTYAQHGEDRVLLKKCGRSGRYLDIGANHPFLISNTYLLYESGWRGVTVEPIRSLAAMQRRWRPGDTCINAAIGSAGTALHFYELYPDVLSTLERSTAAEIEARGDGIVIADYDVPIISGREVVERHFADQEVDLLSIDVEGAEMSVLESFDFSVFRPRYILIEHKSFIADDDNAGRRGAFIESLGYVEDVVLGANTLYRRGDLVEVAS
ncbi:FkbM family methyltransferase [Sphingomonas sp. 1P06PA]|uniref:FkbM family methyltransferase n=1 Tax=Sphingomonas sp. 1P06PA TaxID=554121 RepID=UPI0039A44535